MYSSIAFSMSHVLGAAPAVNREKVRWYVGEYRRDRVVRFDNLSMTSGVKPWGLASGAEEVDRRYEMMDCSSENVDCSSFAMYVASAEDDDDAEGIALEGYAILRTAESGSNVAELLSPGASWIVRATWESSSAAGEGEAPPLGAS